MCGLIASLSPAWAGAHSGAVAALSRRGPDASGSTSSGPASFSHTRLEIIGLGDTGAQPVADENGCVLVFNGEIYNYAELARQFDLGRPASDTRVLLALLARFPVDKVMGLLRGMWAFAFWDPRSRTLSAARDHAGIKPLYVTRDAMGRPTVASTVAALLAGPVGREIDPAGLTGYLASGHTGPDRTVYAAVRKIRPGHWFTWTPDEPSGAVRESSGTAPMSEGTAGTVREALFGSVRAHLVSDVPVGVFLSGGVDSTLLAAVAREVSGPLDSFTLAFPGSSAGDESDIAQANARALGGRHHRLVATPAAMAEAAPRFLAEHGEPFGDAACLPLTVLAADAAQHVKVVLCGEGADELFGGYGRYRIASHLRRSAGPLSALAPVWARRRGTKPWARALEAVLWGGGFRSHSALLDDDLAVLDDRAPATEAFLRVASDDWAQVTDAAADHLAAARAYDRARWLTDVYLEKTDRATMASSLEGRLPYLDRDMFGVAPRTVTDNSKAGLRKVLFELFPDVQLPDRKKGLAVDIRAVRDAGLGEHFDAALRPGGLLDTFVGRPTTARLAARAERSTTTFFRLAMLGLWEQMYDPAVDAELV